MTAPLVNRDADVYEFADEFVPERCVANPGLMRRHFKFGKGMRQCLGMNLAYQEPQTFVAGVFRKCAVYEEGKEDQEGPTMQLFETSREDVRMHADYVTPGIRPGSQGVRVVIRE